jgi:hypothetical protein
MANTRLHENLEGEAGKVWLTIEAVSVTEGDDVDKEIGVEVEEGAPRPLPSCTRAPWTLGTAWPETRSIGAGAHLWSAEAISRIRSRGWRGGARAAKRRAKAP